MVRTPEATRKISVCVMDEASQCVEPESLIPLKLGFRKLVMVGDHEQLQATVTSAKVVISHAVYIVRFPINHGYLLPGAAAWLPPVPVLAAAEFPGGRLPPGLGYGGQHAAHGGGAGPGAQAGHAVQDAPGHRALAKQVRGVLPCNRWSILALFLTIIFVDTSTEVF